MKSYYEYIADARQKGYAIAHINMCTIEVLWAIIETAKKHDAPVIIGLSEGERDFFGEQAACTLVKEHRRQTGYPVFINADHTFSFERIKRIIDLGYDSMIVDGAKLPLNDNINLTKEAVADATQSNTDILIEAEIGYIGTSSSLLDSLPDNAALTKEAMPTVDTVADFVKQTQVDLIAPAVGNIHGMLKHSQNPHLNIELITAINQAVSAPMVLHGGSGIPQEDIYQAIKNGMAIVHINTQIRAAWQKALLESLSKKPDQIAPYKVLTPVQSAVADQVSLLIKSLSPS